MDIIKWGVIGIKEPKIGVRDAKTYSGEHFKIQFSLGYYKQTENIIHEVVAVEASHRVGDKEAVIYSETLFFIELSSNNSEMNNDNFDDYVTFFQISLSHARALFDNKLKNTVYGEYLLPAYTNEELSSMLLQAKRERLN